jgi:cell division protease FtsH
MSQLRSLVGGRAAEEVVFGVQTTGAANDLQRATALARKMVSLFGMNDELGLMTSAAVEHQYLEGRSYMDCSDDTAALVDREVQKLLAACYAEAKQILLDNRSLLDDISALLLEKETITGDEMMAIINPPVSEETPTEEPPAEGKIEN